MISADDRQLVAMLSQADRESFRLELERIVRLPLVEQEDETYVLMVGVGQAVVESVELSAGIDYARSFVARHVSQTLATDAV